MVESENRGAELSASPSTKGFPSVLSDRKRADLQVKSARFEKNEAPVCAHGPIHVAEKDTKYRYLYMQMCGLNVLRAFDWGSDIILCSVRTWAVMTRALPNEVREAQISFQGI
jgi:hypothetical protein